MSYSIRAYLIKGSFCRICNHIFNCTLELSDTLHHRGVMGFPVRTGTASSAVRHSGIYCRVFCKD